MSYAIGQVRIEGRRNILDLPEVFIPSEKTTFVVSNATIGPFEDGRLTLVRKSPAGRHENEAAPVSYVKDDQYCWIVPLTEVADALNALDAARRSEYEAQREGIHECG